MIAAVLALSVLVARDIAADGWLLSRALERSSSLSRVPIARVAGAADRLWIRWTDDDGVPARVVEHRFAGEDVLAPSRKQRIELATRHYADALADTHLEDIPVDSASWLYGALIEVALSDDERGDWRPEAALRAKTTMADVPLDQRTSVFLDAGTAFLGHALSIVHEVGRHERRRRARGASLCGHFEVRASLFGLWRSSVFGTGRYTGYYRPETTPTESTPDVGAGRWVESQSVLSVEDRQWWVRAFLDVDWSGDPSTDFAWVCRD